MDASDLTLNRATAGRACIHGRLSRYHCYYCHYYYYYYHYYLMVHNGHVSALLTHICLLGFVFSEDEHTALEQFEGGPCAVIAPVQVLLAPECA